MKKHWLYSTIAGIALLATACGNNAAPDTNNQYGTTGTGAGYSYGDYMTRSNNLVGGYSGTMGSRHNGTYGTGSNNTAFGVDRTTGYYGAASNNTAFRGSGYGATGYGTSGTGMNGYGSTGVGTTGGYGTTGPGYGTAGTGTTGSYQPYGFGNGTAGIDPFVVRAGDQANYRMNNSIYKFGGNTGMRTAGTNGAGNQAGFNRMGYARMDVNYVRTNSDTLSQFHVDRDALAQVVGNVTCSVPGVSTSTVLVTDEEIFVGVNTEGRQAKSAKPKVRMNAMSVSPRWFKVYVTDNKDMIDEMTRIYSRSSNVNVASPHDDRQIDNLIRSFGGSTDSEQMRGRRDANRSMTGTNTAGTQDASTTGRNAGTSMGGGTGVTGGGNNNAGVGGINGSEGANGAATGNRNTTNR